MLVLSMLFSYPLLSLSTYITPPDSFEISLKFLSVLDPWSREFRIMFQAFAELQ